MNRIVLLLVAVVLIGIAGFGVIWMGFGVQPQPLPEQILEDWREGRLKDVYERASTGFRERQTATEFQAYMDYWAGELGAYSLITKRHPAVSKVGPGGVRQVVRLELAFKNGPAEMLLYLEAAEPEPLLEHLHIRRILPAVEQGDQGALEAASRALFAHYNRSEFTALYAALSPELQWDWTQTKAMAQLTRLHGMLGATKEMRLQDTQAAHGELVIHYFEGEFQKGPGKAKVSYGWRAGRWHVIGFVLSPD